jgi:hypothetical protein
MMGFFESVRNAGLAIPRIQRQQAHYEDLAHSIGANLSGMPSYRNPTSKVESAAIELAYLHEELGAQLMTYTERIKQAQAIIDRMHTERFKALLTERYINLCSWPEVTRRLGYSDEKSVHRAKYFAFREAEDCLPPTRV